VYGSANTFGNRTTNAYDALNRRTQLIDPRGSTWTTAYTHLNDGTARLLMTDPRNQVTQLDLNRLGLPANIQYLNESPKYTPDV
jgi:YD repeat-containing protein